MATGFLHDPHLCHSRDLGWFEFFGCLPGAFRAAEESCVRQWLLALAGLLKGQMRHQGVADQPAALAGAAGGRARSGCPTTDGGRSGPTRSAICASASIELIAAF